MPQIIMYWDRVDYYGDPVSGIEIYDNYDHIEIPANASGFRLGLPGNSWDGAWHFAKPLALGSVFTHFGIPYSSSFTGPSPDAIEARGPIHDGDSGSYTFQTPLGAYGITGDAPVINGAGSFVADFTEPEDITWLDSAGADIELPDLPEPHEAPELPPEFFESPPNLKGCFRDFEGELHCPEDMAVIAPSTHFIAHGQKRTPPPPGITGLVASGSGIIPHVDAIVPPIGNVNMSPLGSKVEANCPIHLVLKVTFKKAVTFAPGTVQYQFYFTNKGQVSTRFHAVVDGEKTVSHSVPIPLPPPIGRPPGGNIPLGSDDITVVVLPPDPSPGGPLLGPDVQTIEVLPPNEHKGSVRVEVTNVSGGIVASDWVTYHFVCTEASTRPIVRMGARGAAVTAVQAGINRWLQSQKMPLLKIDGIFGPRTEEAVRAFQNTKHLEIDGIVGLKVWKQLLSLRGEPGAHYCNDASA